MVIIIEIENIPYGHDNAVHRPSNPIEDIILRSKIENANRNGDCIINVGHGYFRPDPNDKIDELEFNEYMAKELSRERKIQSKRLSMKMTFERWREVGILTDNTRETG